MYILLELIEGEPTQLQVFPAAWSDAANEAFDMIAEENLLTELGPDELKNEIVGTLRFAGDDVCSVTLYWKPI